MGSEVAETQPHDDGGWQVLGYILLLRLSDPVCFGTMNIMILVEALVRLFFA